MKEEKNYDLNGVTVTAQYSESDMVLLCTVKGNLKQQIPPLFLMCLKRSLMENL